MQVEAREITFGAAGGYSLAVVPQLNRESPVKLSLPGQLDLANGWRINAKLCSDTPLEMIRQNKDPWQAFVALEAGETLWLRPSLPGERFQPLGMGGRSQAIQDLLSDRKVARGKRTLWPIVATTGHPVWIVGQHMDERARVTEKTCHIVRLICLPNTKG